LLRPAAGRFAFLRKRYRRARRENGNRLAAPGVAMLRRGSVFTAAATLAMGGAGA
jgi:hypothetical protein